MSHSLTKTNWIDLANCMRGVQWLHQTRNSISGSIPSLDLELSVRELSAHSSLEKNVQVKLFDAWTGRVVTTELTNYALVRASRNNLLQDMVDSMLISMITRLFKDVYSGQNPTTPIKPLPTGTDNWHY